MSDTSKLFRRRFGIWPVLLLGGAVLMVAASRSVYAVAAPTLTSVAPTSGSIAGGDSITLTGTNFVAGDTVTVGGAAATDVTVVNSTTITATTPAAAIADTVDVTVMDSSGQNVVLASSFTYTDSSLVGWWKLAGDTNDSATSPNNATNSGATPVAGPTGTSNTAYNFDGTSNYMSANAANLPTGNAPFTQSVWIAPTSMGSTYGHPNVLAWGTGSNNQTNGLAIYSPSTGVYHLLHWFYADDNEWTIPNLVDGKWHHLAVTYDGTIITAYLDGASLGSQTPPSTPAVTSGTSLFIGRDNMTANYFSGGISDIKIYNKALSSADITSLYDTAEEIPQITGISPGTGSIAGGDSVTLTGTGFAQGDTVAFGGVAATDVTVVNSTTITATTPAVATSRTVDVTVTDSSGQQGTLTNGFTYLESNLVGWWKLDGNATDSSGHGNNGTLGGSLAATADRNGVAGGAINFPVGSTANRVTISPFSGFPATALTASFWIKTSDTKASGIISYSTSNSTANEFLVYTPTALQLYIGELSVNLGLNIADGQWHNMVFTWQSSNGAYQAYEDGSLVKSGTIAAGASIADGGCMMFGQEQDSLCGGLDSNQALSGSLDDVRMYGRVLSQAEITNLYEAAPPSLTGVSPSSGSATGGDAVAITGADFATGAAVTIGGAAATNVTVVNSTTITATTPAGTVGVADVVVTNPDGGNATLSGGYTYTDPPPTDPNLVGWWKLDGDATDSSGYGNNGTLNNTTTVADRHGNANSAVSLTGTDTSNVSIPGNASLDVTSQMTFSGWYNWTNGNSNWMFGKIDSGPTNAWYLYADSGFGNYNAHFVIYNGGNRTDWGSSFTPASNTWYDIAVTLSSGTATLYVNGSPQTLTKISGTVTTIGVSTSAPLVFGHYAAGGYNFAGKLDNMQLYNRALSASEIADAYDADGSGAATVTGISPNTGSVTGGDTVTITGTNFQTGTTVTFDGTEATTVAVVNDTTITATTPAGAAGAVDVAVANPDSQAATLAGGYTYKYPPPTVTSISPSSGPVAGGTNVTVTGTGFVPENSTDNAWTSTGKTTATINPEATTAVVNGRIYLYGGNGNGTLIQSAPTSDPTAWTNSSNTLPATALGAQFARVGDTLYMFGGINSSAIMTADASDPTLWTNTGKTLPSNLSFSHLATVGSTMYLFGGSTTSCGVAASIIYSAPTSDPTLWTNTGKTLPAGVCAGSLVKNSTNLYLLGNYNNGAATNTIYTASLSDPTTWTNTGKTLPAGVGVANTAVVGNMIYLLGGSATATQVVNTIYAALLADPTTWTSTGKPLPTSLRGGNFAIIGSAMYIFGSWNGSPSGAIYTAPVTRNRPNVYNPPAMTNWQTISSDQTGIAIGGVPLTNVDVSSSSQITGTTAAHATGITDVTATNYDGQSGTLTSGYTYADPAPTVTSLSLSDGDVAGGDSVTISGTGFLSGDTVSFGSAAATNVTIVNSTTLTATVPAAATPGTVDVTITDQVGQAGTLPSAYTYTSGVSVGDTWIGGAAGAPTDWWTAANWSRGRVPGSNDDVVIDGGTDQPTITMSGPYTVHSLSIGANSASILTVANGSTTNVFTTSGDLTIGKAGVLTHSANTNTQVNSLVVSAGGDVTIASGGSINVIGKGYAPANGPGRGSAGKGPGYGGDGLNYDATYGNAYGSATQPTDLGSGGYYSYGAGAVKLTAHAVTINGSILAGVDNADGTGGSIWVTTSTSLSGNGTIKASGGGSAQGFSSGGRIALYYDTNSFSGSISANGYLNAGAGTIYMKGADTPNGKLIVRNSYTSTAAPTPQLNTTETYDSVQVAGHALYVVDDGQILNAGTFVAADTGANSAVIQNNGTITSSGTTLTNYYIYDNGTYTDSNLTIGSGTTFELDNTSPTTPWNIEGDLTVANGGTITSPANTTAATYAVNISATNITVASGGSINENGKGFIAQNGPGTTTSDAGASYGGLGSRSSSSTAIGPTYGSLTQPIDIGSGGGAAHGGSGGGSVQLNATGSVVVNGIIGANGTSGGVNVGGGGSGGSIWLTGASISGTGSLTANGGSGYSNSGGSGGGGRIAFTYTSPLALNSVVPSSGSAAGGDSVTILGSGLNASTELDFGSTIVTTTYVNDTTLTVTTPAVQTIGSVDVTATNRLFDGVINVTGGAGGFQAASPGTISPTDGKQTATLANGFTYTAGAPTVSDVSPLYSTTAGGATLTITGTNFFANSTVTIDGVDVPVTYVNSTTLTTVTPAHAAGTVGVVVHNADGKATAATDLIYDESPTVTGILPAQGSTLGGDTITISGAHFMPDATVTLDGVAATSVNYVNATTLTAVTPVHAQGAVSVVVTNTDDISGTLAAGYTYMNPPPTVSSFAPQAGKMQGGDTVTFTGSGFDDTLTAYFGGVAATTLSATSTTLRVQIPAGALGDVAVSISGPKTLPMTTVDSFRYVPDAYAFTTAPLTLHATEPGFMTVEAHDKDGNIVVTPYDITLNLTSTSDGASFGPDGSTWGMTTVTIPAGQSAASFYYKDANKGTPTVTATGLAGVSVSQAQTITSRYILLVTGVSDPINAGVPSSITVQAIDWQGIAVNDYTGTVHFTSDDAFASIPDDFTITSDMRGHHTFVNGVTMVTTGEHCVSATDTDDSNIAGSQCNITVAGGYSGAASKLAVITDPQSAENATPTSAITVQVQDKDGNPAPVPLDTTVYVSSSAATGSFSADGVTGWTDTQPFAVTIKANTSSANIFYKDSADGTKTLSFRDQASVTDTGLTDTSQSVYIGAGPPAQLVMSAPSSRPFGGWEPVSVYLQDENSIQTTNPDTAQPVYFTSDNPALAFSAASDGTDAGGSLSTTIPVGGNHVTVYIHTDDVAVATITASDASPADGVTGLDDTSHTINFVAHTTDNTPSKITVSTSASTPANQAVAVTITTFNDLDQQAASDIDTTIPLSDQGHGGSFSLSSTSWSPVTSAVLPAGDSSMTVYYKSAAAGSVTLRAGGVDPYGTAVLTVTPGAYTQLVLSGSSSVAVTDATGYAVTAEDVYGNSTTVENATPVYLYTTSGTGSFATASEGPWTVTSVTIPAGGSSANFYYKDAQLGRTATLTASDQSPLDDPDVGIANATLGITVVGQTAATFGFTTSPQSVAPGVSSHIITIQAQKADGAPAIQGHDLTVSLGSDSSGTHGFTATQDAGASSITSVTIPAGATTASFYYHDTKTGVHQLSVAAGSAHGGQAITITTAVASKLKFVTPAQNGQTNQPSQQIEITTTDTYGNPAAVSFDTLVTLSSDCLDSSFSLDGNNWQPIDQLTIPDGSGTAFFYFKTSAASCTMTVSANGFTSASQMFTAATGPAKISLGSFPATMESGQPVTVSVSLEDAAGNLMPALGKTYLNVFVSGGSVGSSTIVIPAGSSTGSLTFTAGAAGPAQIQVRDESTLSDPDTGLIDAVANLTVVPGEARSLYVTPLSGNATVNTAQKLTIHLANQYGVALNAESDTVVSLANDGSGTFTATDDVNGPAVTAATIPAGSSTADVYYHQTATGVVHFTMSSDDLASGTATLAFLSGQIARYQFVTAPTSAEIGQTQSFSVQALDAYGNVVPLVKGQYIYVSSSSATGSFGGGYDVNAHAIVTTSVASAVGFTYRDTVVGSDILTVSDTTPPDDPDTGITNATTTIAYTAGVPTKLVFVSAPNTFERGGTTDQMHVVVQNKYGLETPVGSDTALTLTTTSPTGRFALSNAGPWTLQSLTIQAGSSAASFYYRDNSNIGTYTLTVSSDSLTQTTQDVTVTVGAPSSLAFLTPPQTLYANHISPAITVGVNNRYGYPTTMQAPYLLSLSSTSATAQFAHTVPNWGVTSIAWPAGAGSVSLYYRDSIAGQAMLHAGGGLTEATQPITIVPQVFDHFLVTNISDPQMPGTPSSVVVVAQDAENYTVASYSGTIHFTSSDPTATLPTDYTFQPYTDKGLHTFVNGTVFTLPGEQTVTATDVTTGQSGTQEAITVIGPNGTTGDTTDNPGGNGSDTSPGQGTGTDAGTNDSGSDNSGGSDGQSGTTPGGTDGRNADGKSAKHPADNILHNPVTRAVGAVVGKIGGLGKHILSSPAAPYVVPGIFYLLVAGFAGLLIWDMYREIRTANILLAILKRERQTAQDKNQFLNLVAHHVRTPVTIIAGGAELLGSMLQGDRYVALLADCSKRLQAAANTIVESITAQTARPADANVPAQATLERKLYLSPLFWMPVGISLVLTWLINWLGTAVGHQDIHAITVASQLFVAAIVAALLYSALRGRNLRRRRTEALEQSLAHRKQLDDAKNAFILSVSTQLRSYTDELSSLDSYLQQKQPAAAKPFHSGVQQLQKLVATMETLSTIDTTTVQTSQFELASVLDTALHAHTEQIAVKQLAITATGTTHGVLSQNQHLLMRVTDTLLDNAIAFSPAGGKIRVNASETADSTVLSIADSGPGLPKAVTEQLLQPFTHPENTLTETHQGLGLSLYLDTLIMRHLGGSLQARSGKDGTTVTLRIPKTSPTTP